MIIYHLYVLLFQLIFCRTALSIGTDIVCANNNLGGTGKFSKDICADPAEWCGVEKTTGYPIGCVKDTSCPKRIGKDDKQIECDGSAANCCCKVTESEVNVSGEKICNDLLNQNDDAANSPWEKACIISELKITEVCKTNPTNFINCNDETTSLNCFPFQACGIDITSGDLQGCVDSANTCPATLADPIACDSSKPNCCCKGKLNPKGTSPTGSCNDLSNPSIKTQACKLKELASSPACTTTTNNVVCANNNLGGTGKFSKDICADPAEWCGVEKTTGYPIGCVKDTSCPKRIGKDDKQIECDGSASNCCCKVTENEVNVSGEKICNDLLNQNDDAANSPWEKACIISELKITEVCKTNPTNFINCNDETTSLNCFPFQACGIDITSGDLQGCVDSVNTCPATLADPISCDSSKPNCCCKGKLNPKGTSPTGSCNDLTNPSIKTQACKLKELASSPACTSTTNNAVCANNNLGSTKQFSKDICGDPAEWCGVEKATGYPIGCVKDTTCPTSRGTDDKQIECDGSATNCCCKVTESQANSGEKLCNDLLNQNDDAANSPWEKACIISELKITEVCKTNPTNFINCNDKTTSLNCFPFQACGIDRTSGDLQGCVDSAKTCPATLADPISCDSSKPNCCCKGKLNPKGTSPTGSCNDFSNPSIKTQACKLAELTSSPACTSTTNNAVCANNNLGGTGKFSKDICADPAEWCGVEKTTGYPIGCVKDTTCPTSRGTDDKQIECDGSATNCCCKVTESQANSGEKLCNDLLNQNDDAKDSPWEKACIISELKITEVCKTNPTNFINCNDETTSLNCFPFQACGIDRTSGLLQGCVDSANTCPATLADPISCDLSKPSCCCKGKLNPKGTSPTGSCNDIKTNPSIKTQACSLAELASSPACTGKPTISEKEVEDISLKVTGYSMGSYEGTPCDQILEDYITNAAKLQKVTPPNFQAIYDELAKVDSAISSPPAPLLCNRFRLMMCISGKCNCAAGTEQRYSYKLKIHSYHCYANSGSCKQDITELIPMLKVDKEKAYKHYGDPSIPLPGGNNQWHNNEEKCLLNVCTRLEAKTEKCEAERDVGLPSFNDFKGKQQTFANNWEDDRRKRSYNSGMNKTSRGQRKTLK